MEPHECGRGGGCEVNHMNVIRVRDAKWNRMSAIGVGR